MILTVVLLASAIPLDGLAVEPESQQSEMSTEEGKERESTAGNEETTATETEVETKDSEPTTEAIPETQETETELKETESTDSDRVIPQKVSRTASDKTAFLEAQKFFTKIKLENVTQGYVVFEKLKDEDGLTTDNTDREIEVTDSLKYRLEFALNNVSQEELTAGDWAFVDLPTALRWPTGLNSEQEIKDGSGEKICDFSIVTAENGSQRLKFVFTDYFTTHNNTSGYVELSLNVNKSVITGENKVEYDFSFPGVAIDKTLVINKSNATVEKTYEKQPYYKYITFKVTIDSTGITSPSTYYLEDTFSEGLYLKQTDNKYPDIKMGDVSIPWKDTSDTTTLPRYHYDNTNRKITIYPGEIKDKKVTIEYVLYQDQKMMIEEQEQVIYSNDAVYYSGEKTKIDGSKVEIDDQIFLIDKSVIYDNNNSVITPLDETIQWRILVNRSAVKLDNVVVTDIIPEIFFVNDEILNVIFKSKPVNNGDENPTIPYYKIGPSNIEGYKEIKFYLGTLVGAQDLRFETVPDMTKFHYFKDWKNKAEIGGEYEDWKIPVYNNEIGVNTYFRDLQKVVKKVDRKTGVITWQVGFTATGTEGNELYLEDIISEKISETYGNGSMKLIPNSVTYHSKKDNDTITIPESGISSYTDKFENKWSYDLTDPSDPYQGGKIKMKFSKTYIDDYISTDSGNYTFSLEYKTQCDPATFKVDKLDSDYKFGRINKVRLFKEGESKALSTAEAQTTLNSLILEKIGIYDEAENLKLPAEDKYIRWTLKGNKELLSLDNPAFKDPIPSQLKYKEGSIKVLCRPNNWLVNMKELEQGTHYTFKYDEHEGENGTLTVVILEENITGADYETDAIEYWVQFDTTFKDPKAALTTSGTHEFENTGYMTHAEINEYVNNEPKGIDEGKWLSAKAVVEIENVLVDKNSEYDFDDNPHFITWFVDVNDQGTKATDLYFEDKLEDALELDMADDAIEVYKMRYSTELEKDTLLPYRNPDNTYNYSYTYDRSTNTFRFNFEGDLKENGLDSIYRVYFRTYIDKDKLNGGNTIKNSVDFKGEGIVSNSTSEEIILNTAGIETGGGGDFASLKVHKYKEGSNTTHLSGAIFELYDAN